MYGPSTPARTDKACWFCRWYDGMDGSGTLALCSNEGCSRCRSQPVEGCSRFEREPGADDVLEWRPAAPVITPLRPRR